MLKFIEYLVKIIFQYLPIALLVVILLTITYGLLIRVLRLKINNPVFQWLMNLLGLHFLDTSPISLEFHSYLKLICNYSKKIVLNIEPDDLSYKLVGEHLASGYQQVAWTVLDNTVILSVNRSFIFSPDWIKLAKLLLCYRQAQPINSLILCIRFAEDLDGAKLSSRLNMFTRCTYYPIYLALVDLEKIADFSLVPDNVLIGWSCSEIPEKSIYSVTEVPNLISTIKTHIISVLEQMNIQTTTLSSLMLSKSIAGWIDARLIMLTSLFYNDLPLFLRGTYLIKASSSKLLLQLICQENLSTPSNQPRTRYTAIVYHFFLALILVLYLTLPIFYKQIVKESQNLKVLWNHLIEMAAKRDATLESSILEFARHLNTIHDNDLTFGTVPAAWGRNLYFRVRSKLIEVYNFALMEKIVNTFNQTLTQTLSDSYSYKMPAFTCTNPIDTIELHKLYYFIKHLEEVKKFQTLIVSLLESDSFINFNDCVKYLTHQELPAEFFKNFKLYQKARQKKLPAIKRLEDNLNTLERLLENKVNSFFDSIGGVGIKKIASDVADNLQLLEKNPSYYSTNEILKLKQNLIKLKTVIAENKLLSQSDFEIPGQYSDLFTGIESNLGQMMSVKFKTKMNSSFTDLKNELISLKLPVYGPVLVADISGTRFNPELDDMISFIQEMEQIQLTKKIDKLSLIKAQSGIWNQAGLVSAINNMTTFKSFLDMKASLIPISLRLFLIQAVSRIVADKIFMEVANSYREEITQLEEQLLNFNLSLPHLLNIINFFTSIQEHGKASEVTNLINDQYGKLLSDLYVELDQAGIFSINSMSILNSATTDKIINEFIQSNRTKLESYYLKVKTLINQMEKIYRGNIIEPQICSTWKRIADYFIPNTDVSLEVLENYIKQILKAQNLEELSHINNPDITGNDFVAKKINEITQVVEGKINLSINSEVEDVYRQVKTMFDINLCNYFPFASLTAPDIPKRQFLQFYDFWSSKKDRINNVLKLCKNRTNFKNKPWCKFLGDLIAFMPWIELLQNNTPLIIKLRDRTNPEKNVEYLTLWKLVGEFDPFHHYFQNQGLDFVQMEYQMNQPPQPVQIYTKIDMACKLADTSPFVFATGNPRISGISEDGPFALLRLLNRYYSHQDQDTIYLKINYKLKNTQSIENELISWISLKSSLDYCKAPQIAPEFT